VTSRAIVLDANILVRAVLGSGVSDLLAAHAGRATFLAPDFALDEAREHLPASTWTTAGVELYFTEDDRPEQDA
jgi:hypothetical protein